LAVSIDWFLMKPCKPGIITLFAMAGRASRSKNWLMNFALAITSAHFLFSGGHSPPAVASYVAAT
jgi:hypothetical protein